MSLLHYGVSPDCTDSESVSSTRKEYAGVLRRNIKMGLFIVLRMRPGKGRFNSGLLKDLNEKDLQIISHAAGDGIK